MPEPRQRFTEPHTQIDWAHSRKSCGHSPWEQCRCEDELWNDYAVWAAEREQETCS